MNTVHVDVIGSCKRSEPSNYGATQSFEDSNLLNTPKAKSSSLLGRSLVSVLSVFSRNSSLFCRICHEGEQEEELVSPCLCRGSVSLVHRSCIQKWLSTANQDACELCGHTFTLSRQPRPCSKWLTEPYSAPGGGEQRHLVGDCLRALVLTPLTAAATFICLSGAAYYWRQGKPGHGCGLVALALLLVAAYLGWLILSLRYHCLLWAKWRDIHQDVRLIEENISKNKIASIHSNSSADMYVLLPDNVTPPKPVLPLLVPLSPPPAPPPPPPMSPLVLPTSLEPSYTSHLHGDGEVYTVLAGTQHIKEHADLVPQITEHSVTRKQMYV